jgi:hypothetical protein
MYERRIVPDDQIPNPPLMGIHKSVLGREVEKEFR